MGEAMAAGIPVICLERDISAPNYTTFIGVDNRAVGRTAGEYIRDELTRRNGGPTARWLKFGGCSESKFKLSATMARVRSLAPMAYP